VTTERFDRDRLEHEFDAYMDSGAPSAEWGRWARKNLPSARLAEFTAILRLALSRAEFRAAVDEYCAETATALDDYLAGGELHQESWDSMPLVLRRRLVDKLVLDEMFSPWARQPLTHQNATAKQRYLELVALAWEDDEGGSLPPEEA
jgi:hypothetical protein